MSRRRRHRFALGGWLAAVLALTSALPSPAPAAPRPGLAPARAAGPFQLVPQYEPPQALLLSCAQRVQFHPGVFVEIARACAGELPILAISDRPGEVAQARSLLREAGVSDEGVRFAPLPTQSMWLRDYGPVWLRDARGRLVVGDTHYEGTGQNPDDDLLPLRLSEALQLPHLPIPLAVEGGNLLGNGRGLLLSSTALVERNRRDRGYTEATVDSILHRLLGTRLRAGFSPLRGEATQHVDMYLSWLGPRRVVVGRYEPADAPRNARLLDRVAGALEGLPGGGGPVEVSRVDFPPPEGGVFRTYTNIVLAGGIVLVPVYGGPQAASDAQALALYRRLLPGRRIVGIQSEGLIQRNGSLHCIAVTMPAPGPGPRSSRTGSADPPGS